MDKVKLFISLNLRGPVCHVQLDTSIQFESQYSSNKLLKMLIIFHNEATTEMQFKALVDTNSGLELNFKCLTEQKENGELKNRALSYVSFLDGSSRRESINEDPPWPFGWRQMKGEKERKIISNYNVDEGLLDIKLSTPKRKNTCPCLLESFTNPHRLYDNKILTKHI